MVTGTPMNSGSTTGLSEQPGLTIINANTDNTISPFCSMCASEHISLEKKMLFFEEPVPGKQDTAS